MTNPTPNSLSPQGVPNNSARCLGSGSDEDGEWHWREGCDDCQRRYGWAGGWIDPPPIIAFECEYRIAPMTDLSPAAQAVLDAYWETFNAPLEGAIHRPLAAALRALADQLRLDLPLGDTDADAGVFVAHHAVAAAILAIATELEGTNGPV